MSSFSVRQLLGDTAVLAAGALSGSADGPGALPQLLVATPSRLLVLRWEGERATIVQELRTYGRLTHAAVLPAPGGGGREAALVFSSGAGGPAVACYSRGVSGELVLDGVAELAPRGPAPPPPLARPAFSGPVCGGRDFCVLAASLHEGLLHLVVVRWRGGEQGAEQGACLEVSEHRLADVVSAEAGETFCGPEACREACANVRCDAWPRWCGRECAIQGWAVERTELHACKPPLCMRSRSARAPHGFSCCAAGAAIVPESLALLPSTLPGRAGRCQLALLFTAFGAALRHLLAHPRLPPLLGCSP